MRQWRSHLTRLVTDRKAATAVEYGLILAMVVLATVGALQSVGGQTGSMWNNISAKVLGAN
jgi:pilus assembly protein Flp/PilA